MIAQQETRDPAMLDKLATIRRCGNSMLSLLNDVLDLSRIEAGRVTMSVEPVSLPEVLRDVVNSLDPMASRQQVAL